MSSDKPTSSPSTPKSQTTPSSTPPPEQPKAASICDNITESVRTGGGKSFAGSLASQKTITLTVKDICFQKEELAQPTPCRGSIPEKSTQPPCIPGAASRARESKTPPPLSQKERNTEQKMTKREAHHRWVL